MQTDILASAVRTTDGQLLDQAGGTITRARVKSILIVPTAIAGSVIFRDGGASGPIRSTINTMASMTCPQYMLLPGEGLLFQNNIYVDVADIVSVMVFYG